MTLDLTEEDLASPPAPRKFIQLKDSDMVPGLVKRWKGQLKKLETMQVSCRVVEGDCYRKTKEADFPLMIAFPLIFGSKCDCGRVHFCIDAEDDVAKNLGILKADE